MKATSALFDAARHPVEWTDDPDKDPPPGRQFAQALIDDLASASGVRILPIGNHSYEHGGWFFFFEFEGSRFQVNLEGHLEDRRNTTWRICVGKSRGILASLFGGRDGRLAVPDDCLRLLQNTICRVCGIEEVRWQTEDETLNAFLS